MPPRKTRTTFPVTVGKSGKNKSRKRNLDAYAIASHQTTGGKRNRIAPHRLGEIVVDESRSKRRRLDVDDEGAEQMSDEDSAPPPRKYLQRRDEVEEGSDSEGNEWKLGGLQDDDSDSDLDSDEAFGSSDEERFEGFAFRGSSSGKTKNKKTQTARKNEEITRDIDLNEDDDHEDEVEEDEFGDEGVDLATMLDGSDDEADAAEETRNDAESDSEESSDTDGESEVSESELGSDEDAEDQDDEAADEERHARLRDRIDALDATAQQPVNVAPSVKESELTLSDLLASSSLPATNKLAAALNPKKASKAPKELSVPLPKRQQDRVNRAVASEKAIQQLNRWRDTVIHNRRAEFLSFPLQDPNRAVPLGKDKFNVQTAPQNELEESIQKIMEESGISSKVDGNRPADEEGELIKAEELGTNKLPIEEVLRRRASLRRARELLFREEIKAKRIAKIKSRSYRRVHRKQKERQAAIERAEREMLGIDDESEREYLERKRAESRMETKHRDSKWAKTLKATNRTVWDEGARDSVHEEARRREELQRRIEGKEVFSGEEHSDASSDDDHEDDDISTLRQLQKLKEREIEGGKTEQGLAGMKFMRAAAERQRKQNEEDIARLKKEIQGDQYSDVDGSEESGIDDQGLGRAIFGPQGRETSGQSQKRSKRPELQEGNISEDDSRADPRTQGTDGNLKVDIGQSQKQKGPNKKISKGSGPLVKDLGPDRRDPAVQRQHQETELGAWLSSETAPKKSRKDKQLDLRHGEDTILDLQASKSVPAEHVDMNKPQATANHNASIHDSSSAGRLDGWQTIKYGKEKNSHENAGDHTSPEPEDPIITAKDRAAEYQSRAFAADDVAAAFDAEKAELMASEDEKEVSTHLPGWGSWTGHGLSKSIRKANKKAAHNPLFKHKLPGGVKPEQRKDAKLDRVIISEKQDRKGKKYLAPMLPHEFETKVQYEGSLRLPVGPEWSTKEVFQRETRPRVVVQRGRVVEAIQKPLV
ncbi:hypothetical protein M433DRAFT_147999 [Acidomyces richmondensis BFW]|nr:hypothetical protein M433DRAFT_147999 [Acidomyces richmondensis BFW]